MDGVMGVGSLEEEAKRRKQRLEDLRRTGGTEPTDQPSQVSHQQLPTPIFRNYRPSDSSLKQLTLEKCLPESLEETMKREHEETLANQPQALQEVDLENLAPKKVDWDLKRILQKSLDKLERRTQRSIAELIRERIKSDLKQDTSKGNDAVMD